MKKKTKISKFLQGGEIIKKDTTSNIEDRRNEPIINKMKRQGKQRRGGVITKYNQGIEWLNEYTPLFNNVENLPFIDKFPQGGSLFNKDSVYKYAPRIGERINDGGSVSTHLMTSSDNLAYPTLFQNTKDSSWYELPPREAYYEAKKKGEIFRFKTDQEADSFAGGGWKPKYPSGGYLNYQDDYKGFGVGPLLTQDNSYYRSIMPTTREDIDAEINKSTTFGDIGNAIGGISQGINEAGSLLSRFSGTQNPPQTNHIMPDISGWGVGQKSDEQLNYENDQAMKKSGVYNNFYPQQDGRYNPEGLFNEGLRGQRINSNVDSLGNIGFGKNGGRVAHCEDGGIPVGYPEYIHPSNVFQPHVIPVPKVHFSDDTTAFDMGTNLNDLVQMNGGKVKDYKYGGTVRELYESLTGKDWKTAKKDGLTDGSYSSNIKLRKKLLADLESRRKDPELREYTTSVVRSAPELREYNSYNITPNQNYNEFENNVLPTFPYGGHLNYPRPFNSNSNRMGARELQNATSNDFMHTKLNHDRQKFTDNKVDWGIMDWAKEPVGAITGMASTIPIVGDIVNNAVGDSFLTRTGGYQVGQGVGRVAQGAGQVVGGAVTGNPMMVASGVGEIGGGIGSTIGNLEAEGAMGGYDKSGYISGKRTAKSANDFSGMMSSAGGLYGNVMGGIDSLKDFGGLGGMMDNLRGGQKGLKGFGNAMFNMYGNGIRFEDGGDISVPKWASYIQADDEIEGGYNFEATYPAYWYSTKKLDSSRRQKHFNMIVNDMIESGVNPNNIPRDVRNVAGYGLELRDLYNTKPNIGFDAREVEDMYKKYDKNNFMSGGKVTKKQDSQKWLDKY